MTERHIILQKTGKGRRIAIGDIHGCAKTLKALVLKQLKPNFDDQIFFLGDYINRGDDSAGVIDFILALKMQGYQVFTLSGNHEIMALEKGEYTPTPLDKDPIISAEHKDFLENLPYCYQMEDFIFVHAGINFKSHEPFKDYEAMLWERYNDVIPPNITAKIIHGHTILAMKSIKEDILSKKQIIGIDNGCYRGLNPELIGIRMGHYGHLCALDVDNWVLYTQKCVD